MTEPESSKPAEDRDPDGWVGVAANPYGGAPGPRARLMDLVGVLEQDGRRVETSWTPDERSEMIERANEDSSCRCLVAAGGDGTIADLVNERPRVPIAVFPLGNENLFAREFGYGLSPPDLAATIRTGTERAIDLGNAAGQRFCLMASVGFDADVAHRVAGHRLAGGGPRKVGRLSYTKPILASLRNYPYSRLELDVDGASIVGTHALVFNIPRYGFHLHFAPSAVADDGMLDWVVFSEPGIGSLASYFWSVLREKHLNRKDVQHGQARKILIRSVDDVPAQADGDPAGQTPVDIEVEPAALRLLVPRPE